MSSQLIYLGAGMVLEYPRIGVNVQDDDNNDVIEYKSK
jgi:hypothetical protein